MDETTMTCRPLPPEDIRPGQYAAVLHAIAEIVLWWNVEDAWQTPRTLRIQHVPHKGTTPVKVLDVCLPYVFVQTARGKHRTLDVRRFRLAQVSNRFGRLAFEQYDAEKKAEETAEKADSAKDD